MQKVPLRLSLCIFELLYTLLVILVTFRLSLLEKCEVIYVRLSVRGNGYRERVGSYNTCK